MSTATVPLRAGAVSWLLPVRSAVVSLAGLVLLFGLLVAELSLGDFEIPFGDVIRTLFGAGDAAEQLIVLQLRLPQTLVAILVGCALGMSGALTQTFARNPLASPDILGITQGAAFGAVTFIALSGVAANPAEAAVLAVGLTGSAFIGAFGTAAALYVLAWRRGLDGQRLVLVGIGIGAALGALTSWGLVRMRLMDAASATIWLNGSLTARGWEQVWPLLITLGVLAPVAGLLIRQLNALQLGDDSASGLGVRLEPVQLLVLVVAVGLAAVAVSAVGPLEFVAFVVPQIALRLSRASRPPLVASAVFGACLVVFADLVVRVVLPFGLPAGLVTAAIGAPYLIWLLLRSNRKVSA